jgi:hypothetical protein
MRQTIRALGLTIYVLWLVIVVFTVTAVYSAFQLGVSFGEPQTSTSGGTMTLSLPFSVQNNGFYDISNLNITTIIQEINRALIANSSTLVPPILSGKKVDVTHHISITLDKMTPASLSRLLFNDTDFNVDMILALTYAGVIPLKISTNSTMTWGAPLYNLTIGSIDFNSTSMMAVVPVSFENHSFFNLNGTMQIEIVDALNQTVGSKTIPINVPSESDYPMTWLEVPVSASDSSFKVRLHFDTSAFKYTVQ